VKLERERAALVVIDVQEAFRKAIPGFERIAAAVATLVRGAGELEIPVLVTEQYPRGLGKTVPEVADHLPPGARRFDKVRFSAPEADGFDLAGRHQAIVCGIEAHVCVSQTALDLIDAGAEVQLVADAVGSRAEADRDLALRRIERAGAVLTTVEAALFELLRGSDAPRFRQVQQLVLTYRPAGSR
jgi:nicotinamidase-related amidase